MIRVAALTATLYVAVLPCSADAGELPKCNKNLVPIKSSVVARWPTLESPRPVSGFAVVSFTISRAGDVSDVELIESNSDPHSESWDHGFAIAAIESVTQWRYATQEVACRHQTTITFRYSDD